MPITTSGSTSVVLPIAYRAFLQRHNGGYPDVAPDFSSFLDALHDPDAR